MRAELGLRMGRVNLFRFLWLKKFIQGHAEPLLERHFVGFKN